jgi:DNA-binding NarL/FixJ family response regulator
MALRVVFAEDNYLVRHGTAALLDATDSVDLVAVVEDLESLMSKVDQLLPDAVLTDIRMPPNFTDEGIEAAKRIRAKHRRIGVVVLSQYEEESYVFSLLEDGVEGLGYLLKERISDVDELVRALQEVARGGSALDPKVVQRLLKRTSGNEHSALAGLTDRELEVLQAMASGRSNTAIAKSVFMSERSVEKHISSVFHKLGLNDDGDLNRRVSAVLTYLEAGGSTSQR